MKIDKPSQDKINKLHPSVREEVAQIVNECNEVLNGRSQVRIAQGLRTFAEQDALYKQRPKVTNAKGGQSVHNYGFACFSEDTRVFTNNGLKYFKDLEEKDNVLTFKDNFLEFQKPLLSISNDHDGDMISIKTRSVDLLVTPNHKMIVQEKINNLYNNEWDTINADVLTYKHRIPTTGKSLHNNNFVPIFNKYNVDIDIKDSKDWYEFMGYWLSEGSVGGSKYGRKLNNNNKYRITISQTLKNKDVFDKIRNCLERLDFNFSYQGHDFVIHNKSLWEYLFNIGNSYDKFIPKEMFYADKEHLERLYYAMVDGDGSYYDNGEYYTSVSKQLSEDFLTIAILLNKSGVISSRTRKKTILPQGEFQKSEIKPQYEVRTRLNTTQELRSGNNDKKILKQYYKGKVYCVNTEAGAIVVERNGKVAIAGNCDIVLIIDGKVASWDVKKDWDNDKVSDWDECVKVFAKFGWSWGGNWNGGFKDMPHFDKIGYNNWRILIKLPRDKNGYIIL
jgi:hypothetical protein